ncbi:MAG: DUF3341 domain-containing protein [Bacteroidota bacterium]
MIQLPKLFQSEPPNPVFGVMGEFPHPGALLDAARGVREAGYTEYDTYSPFPIHGMDDAMGLGQSILGYIVFIGGIMGVSAAMLMQWWMGAVDYPLNISGKPAFAWEPSVPVAFELMILLSALAAVGGMLALNRLPRPYNPLFYSQNFTRSTDDGFFLCIESVDGLFTVRNAEELLERLGAQNIEVIYDHGKLDEDLLEGDGVSVPADPQVVSSQ